MTVGISGYGVYVPKLRIKKEEYAKAWGSFAASGVAEKSLMGFDEDVLTSAAKAAGRALESVPMGPEEITRFALASTSAPYVEKLLSGTVMVHLGVPNGAFCSDHTTSSRSGTEAIISSWEHVQSNPSGRALVAIADAPKSSMWSTLEHGLGAGSAAFVLSTGNLIAEFEGHASFANEHFGSRFRPSDDQLIHDLNVKKFAQSSFVGNTTKAGGALMKKIGSKPDEYAHVVIQQPDARSPSAVAKKLGFKDEQMASCMVSKELGDLGAASTAVALAAALDSAKVGERIFVVSYGSGAASDAISLKVVGDRKARNSVRDEVERKEYIDYVQYLKLKGAIR
ncbi:MAG: hydroxymethylglutaryl-CoA synthase [Thermoplasmata archaeon]|nr:hydroxymethylglutaryl-CoA synthase [Thermoplasmata archaeon]